MSCMLACMSCSFFFFFFGFGDFQMFFGVLYFWCEDVTLRSLMYRAEKRREKAGSMGIERMYAEC